MTKSKKTKSFKSNPHCAAILVLQFVNGARLQVERLLSAQQMLKYDEVTSINRCYHETSNLFEDLATIVQYLNLLGVKTKKDQLFFDIRDCIRHDIREEFDIYDKRKLERAARLGIGVNMQFELSYEIGVIKFGDSIIHLNEVTDFINLAEQNINTILYSFKIDTEEEGEQ